MYSGPAPKASSVLPPASIWFISCKPKSAACPRWRVLPLFLVPEIVSHVGGIWAALLLLEDKLGAAILVGVFVKGIAAVLTVWIYQNCEHVLLSIGWFAWLHAQTLRLRGWAARRTARLRVHAAQIVSLGRSRVKRRFSALRLVIAARLGLIRRRAHRRQAPRP